MGIHKAQEVQAVVVDHGRLVGEVQASHLITAAIDDVICLLFSLSVSIGKSSILSF